MSLRLTYNKQHLLAGPQMVEGRGRACGLFRKGTNPILRTPPNQPSGAPTLALASWGLGLQHNKVFPLSPHALLFLPKS